LINVSAGTVRGAQRRKPRATRLRAGFALLAALLVLVAVTAIVAGVVALNAASYAEQTRVAHAQNFLSGLTAPKQAIALFQEDINGKTPRTLSQLSTPITTTDTDICGKLYTGTGNPADVDEWSGRYASRTFPATGTPVGIGTSRDTLQYQVEGNAGRALIVIDLVPEEEALRLDTRVDTTAGAGSAAGTVRWTAPGADGTVTLTWVIPLSRRCGAPSASFTFVCAQLTCNFTDTSTDDEGTVVAWSWTFGDGGTSTTRHPTRIYAAGGTFTVTLTATDNDGIQSSASQSVTVRNITLTAVGIRQGQTRRGELTWSGAITANVDIYRNNVLIATTAAAGPFPYVDPLPGAGTYSYKVCEEGTTICSNTSTFTIN
jgi:hypothetical protein